MTTEIQLAIVGSASALLGSLVGGLVTFFTSRHLRKQDWHLEQVDKAIALRESLYSDFIGEAGRLSLSFIEGEREMSSSEFDALNQLYFRIRLFATEDVEKAADDVVRHVMDRGKKPGTPSKSPLPARQFAAICRKELDAIRKRA